MGEVPNKQRCGKDWTVCPHILNQFSNRLASVRRGRDAGCTQGKKHQETRIGTASTVPITVIKGIVDNLAVCFMVFPRVFMCLLLVFVLSCC